MNHNTTSKDYDPYVRLCSEASETPDLMYPVLTDLQKAAQKAVEFHDKAQKTTKHSDLFQGAAETANRYIATYYVNWRRSPKSFDKAPLVPDEMNKTLSKLITLVERYQPFVTKSKAWTSSRPEIEKLHEKIKRLHIQQPEGLQRHLELADLSTDTDIVTGIQSLHIVDPEPTTSAAVNTQAQADANLSSDHEVKWTRPRSTVESVSDEDEPADTAAVRRHGSIREDSDDPHEDDEPEVQSLGTRKRKSTKKSSKDSNDGERASADDSERPTRKKKRTKRTGPIRYVDDSELGGGSIHRSRTVPWPEPQPSQTSPQTEQLPFYARVLDEYTEKANGPVNLNNMFNVYHGKYTYYTQKEPQSRSGQ